MTEAEDESLRRELRTRSISGLLELWDEAMSEQDRRLLVSELDSRGHRTASLEWPEPVEGIELFPAFPVPTREEFRAMGRDERMTLSGAI